MTTVGFVTAAAVALVIVLLLPGDPHPIGRKRARWGLGIPRWLAPVVLFAGGAMLIGGGLGVLIGGAAGIAAAILLPRLESGQARRERLARQSCLPLFVELVAACLSAGVNTDDSLLVAAQAVGPPLEAEIGYAVTSIRWGADPRTVWRATARVDGLAELSRALERSLESGASLAELLPQLAHDVRDRERTQVEARTRTAGVRLMAPLGLMFLPAFVLLGVIPVIASWAGLILGT